MEIKKVCVACYNCGIMHDHYASNCPNKSYCIRCKKYGHSSKVTMACPIIRRMLSLALIGKQRNKLSKTISQLIDNKVKIRKFYTSNKQNDLNNNNNNQQLIINTNNNSNNQLLRPNA